MIKKNSLKKHAQLTEIQQLKKAIAALAVELERAVYPDFSSVDTRNVITKMLLLSGRDKYDTETAPVSERSS